MSVMSMGDEIQYEVLSIVAGILHLGNITFMEQGNYAQVEDAECKFIYALIRPYQLNTLGEKNILADFFHKVGSK